MSGKKKNRVCLEAPLRTVSGARASRIVFGSWALGGWYWGETDDDTSIRAVHAALDAGINAFDTAPVYGFGHSEEILGRALGSQRERVWIATKAGLRWDRNGKVPFFETEFGGVKREVFRNLQRDSVMDECEQSLRRLRTDYIDCLILHWPDPATPMDETLEACERLAGEGKIRSLGVSNFSVEQILEIRTKGERLPLCFDQERFNLLDRRAMRGNIPFDKKYSINFMAYSPLAQGLLSGRVDRNREFERGDLRGTTPLMSLERREAVGERIEQLGELLAEKGVSMATIALAWVLQTQGVTMSVVGIRDENQCRQLARASGVEFSGEEYRRIGALFEELRYHGH